MRELLKNKPEFPLLLLVLCVAAVLYYPGLSSFFAFDDFYNLVTLNLVNKKGFLYYIFSAPAGPSGRPLAALSFVFQYQDWPANPFAFKAVNLLIHGLNGVLVFIVTRQLSRYLDLTERAARSLVLMATALWLLHPIHVNTVLYVVQRMTELSFFFVFAGLAGYMHGRARYERGNIRAGFTIMSFSVVLGTGLAFLSKENGALLPLFILVIEGTVLSGVVKNRDWRIWSWIFIGIPLIVIALYFAADVNDILEGYERRDFSLTERLLTEAVILLVYLKYIIAPNPDDFSFYHDAFPISTGLFSYWYTPVAVALLIFLLVFCLKNANKYRVFSFAVLWFLAGHIIESTFISLELFFEHRNYLPAYGVCVLLSWCLVRAWSRFRLKWLIGTFGAVYIIFIALISGMVIDLWTNPLKQAVVWSRVNPDSERVMHNLVNAYIVEGEYVQARRVLDNINERYPDEIYPELKNITVTYCLEGETISDAEWQNKHALASRASPHNFAIVAEIDSLVSAIQKDNCQMSDIPQLMRFILALATNDEFERFHAALHEFLSLLAIEIHEGRAALANIREANRLKPVPHRMILEARILLGLDMRQEAKQKLLEIREHLAVRPGHYIANREAVNRLETRLGMNE